MTKSIGFKMLSAFLLLASSSQAFAFNETICSGLVNGKEVAHADRVNPYAVGGIEFYRDNATKVVLDMDPVTNETELRLEVIDIKSKQVLATAKRESRYMGSKVEIDQKVATFSGKKLNVQITCENQYGD